MFCVPGEQVLVSDCSDRLSVTVLINPQSSTLTTNLRQIFSSPSPYTHLLYAGHSFSGTGNWILQDNAFRLGKLARAFCDPEVDACLKQNPGQKMSLSVAAAEGDWTQEKVNKQEFGKQLTVKVNPDATGSVDGAGVQHIAAFLAPLIKARSCEQLLQASDVIGNIRFSRPTLYIFPASQGSSALFGISGFNFLVDGGYSRKPCFWDFTRHLDRIDAMLISHLGESNLFGMSSVAERKAQSPVHPEIGYVYFNGVDGSSSNKHSPNGDLCPENGGVHKDASLVVSLVDEGQKLCESLCQMGQVPQRVLAAPATSSTALPSPINLYHKVGHGSLDMYVLNPSQDSKELKEFLTQWNKRVHSFPNNKAGIPMPHSVSVSALVVWRPAAANEKITRILFPGAASQSMLSAGLDKLKSMDIFQISQCSASSMQAAKNTKKAPASAAAAAKGTRGSVKPSPPSSAREPRKTAAPVEKKAATPVRSITKSAPTKSSASASSKPAKDAKNVKKAGVVKKSPGSTPSASKTASKSTTPSTTPAETPKQAATPSNTPQEATSPTPDLAPEPVAKLIQEEVAAAAASVSAEPQAVPEPVPEPIMPELSPKQPEPEPSVETVPKEPEPTPEPVKEPTPEPPREPTPEPVKEPTPEPPREPTPEPVKEPTPEPPRDPTPEPVKEPTPEPPREPTPEIVPEPSVAAVQESSPDLLGGGEPQQPSNLASDPFSSFGGGGDQLGELSPPAAVPEPLAPSIPIADGDGADLITTEAPETVVEPKPADLQPQQAWGAGNSLIDTAAPVAAPVPAPVDSVPADVGDDSAEESIPEPSPTEPAAPLDEPEALPEPQQFDTQAFGAAVDTSAPQKDLMSQSIVLDDNEEKDIDTAAIDAQNAAAALLDDINANEAPKQTTETSQEEQLPTEEVFGGAAPEGLPSPPEPTALLVDDEQDSLEGSQDPLPPAAAASKPDNAAPTASPAGMSKEMMEEIGIFEGDDDADAQQPPAECDLLGDISSEQQAPAAASDGFNMPSDQYPAVNPFVGIGDESASNGVLAGVAAQEVDRDSLERDEFDPLKEWGHPEGLPAPAPPTSESSDKKTTRNGPSKAAAAKPGAKKAAAEKKPPASASSAKTATTRKPASAPAAAAAKRTSTATPRNGAKTDSTTTSSTAAAKKSSSAPTTSRTTTSRTARSTPSSAGAKSTSMSATTKSSTTAAPKRATATSSAKSAPAPKPTPVTPFHVDLTYIPTNGGANDTQAVDLDFFRRVRARYYVLSALEPCPKTLDALLAGKATWEDTEAEVTIIPTYDTDDLRRWMGLNREQLASMKVDVAPSASRCTIQLQDHHTTCSAYRLEF